MGRGRRRQNASKKSIDVRGLDLIGPLGSWEVELVRVKLAAAEEPSTMGGSSQVQRAQ